MYVARDLFSPSCIKQILETYSLSPNRKFGQNFLVNRQIAGRILEYTDLKRGDSVLEVGPGLGTLTFSIAEKTKAVIAIEIDGGFARYLQKACETLGVRNVYILNEDFLRLDPSRVFQHSEPSTAISNFPYSIALKAILKILEEYQNVRRIVGTVQQEIAERIAAKPGEKNYSSVSVYLRFLARTNILESHIAPGSFFPSPDVESSVISVERRRDEKQIERFVFRTILRAAFANRRKSLVNNLLATNMRLNRAQIERIVGTQLGDIKIRAEKLTVEEFVTIALEIQPLVGGERV